MKSEDYDKKLRKVKKTYEGAPYVLTWYFYLAAHACIHALFVLILASPLSALIMLGTHFAIDRGKTKNYYGIHFDQLLHFIVILIIIAVEIIYVRS